MIVLRDNIFGPLIHVLQVYHALLLASSWPGMITSRIFYQPLEVSTVYVSMRFYFAQSPQGAYEASDMLRLARFVWIWRALTTTGHDAWSYVAPTNPRPATRDK